MFWAGSDPRPAEEKEQSNQRAHIMLIGWNKHVHTYDLIFTIFTKFFKKKIK